MLDKVLLYGTRIDYISHVQWVLLNPGKIKNTHMRTPLFEYPLSSSPMDVVSWDYGKYFGDWWLINNVAIVYSQIIKYPNLQKWLYL